MCYDFLSVKFLKQLQKSDAEIGSLLGQACRCPGDLWYLHLPNNLIGQISKYLALLMGEISEGLKMDGCGSSLPLSADPILTKIHLDGI